MRYKIQIIRYLMFMVSIFMMLSVTLPHHHHADGMPCYRALQTETSDKQHDSDESHDCGCNGHNTAVYASVLSHLTDGNIHQYLMPLMVLFDYVYPPKPISVSISNSFLCASKAEPIKDIWIADTLGLRAPPKL